MVFTFPGCPAQIDITSPVPIPNPVARERRPRNSHSNSSDCPIEIAGSANSACIIEIAGSASSACFLCQEIRFVNLSDFDLIANTVAEFDITYTPFVIRNILLFRWFSNKLFCEVIQTVYY